MDITKFLHLLRQNKDKNIEITQSEMDREWAKFNQPSPPQHSIDTSFIKGFMVAVVLSTIIWLGYNQWDDKNPISDNTSVLEKVQAQELENSENIDKNDVKQVDPIIIKNRNGNISSEYPASNQEIIINKNNNQNNLDTQEKVVNKNYTNSRTYNNIEKINSSNNTTNFQNIDTFKNSIRDEDIKKENALLTKVINKSTESNSLNNEGNFITEGMISKTEVQKELASERQNVIESDKTNTDQNTRFAFTKVDPINQVKGYLSLERLSIPLAPIKIARNTVSKWSVGLESNKSIGYRNATSSGRLLIARDLGQRYRLSVGFGVGKNIGFTNEIPRRWPKPGHSKPFHEITWRSNYIELPARLQYKIYNRDKWQILAGPQVSINVFDHHDAKYVFKGSDGVKDEQEIRIDENVSFQYGLFLSVDRRLYRNWNLSAGVGIMHQNNSKSNFTSAPNLNLGLQYKF